MPLFTSQNAATHGRNGGIARARNYEARQQAEHTQDNTPLEPAGFVASQLTRTRKQIEQLNEQFESSTDPKELKALADALARLAEIERILDGRPLPGSRKPSNRPARNSYAIPDPTPADS